MEQHAAPGQRALSVQPRMCAGYGSLHRLAPAARDARRGQARRTALARAAGGRIQGAKRPLGSGCMCAARGTYQSAWRAADLFAGGAGGRSVPRPGSRTQTSRRGDAGY